MTEARLEGRLSLAPLVDSLAVTGPKERREMPEVDRRATCLVFPGVSSGAVIEEPLAVEPVVRLRLRMVTLGGM